MGSRHGKDTPTEARATEARAAEAKPEPDKRERTRASSTSTAATETVKQIDGLLFDCERLSFYHAARRDWFERLHRWAMFLVVFSGTSAFAASASISDGAYLALIPAALGLADVTFNLSGRAREHGSLYQRFCWLRGLLLVSGASFENLATAQQAIHAIYADEPPTYCALDAWSHNMSCAGRGAGPEHQLVIPGWHNALKHVRPFHGEAYRLVG